MIPRCAYDPHSSAAIVAYRHRWVNGWPWVYDAVHRPGDVIPESVLDACLEEDWPSPTDVGT